MTDCIFCKIVNRELPCYKIYEDESFLVFLDIFPYVEGHVLVIPKKHYRWVWDVENVGEYFEIVERAASGVLGFQAVPPELPLVYDGRSLLDLRERIWTKGDVLDYFSVRDNPQIVETPQFGSGVIFFRKCQESKRIIDEWLGAIDWSFSMLDDTPSVSANLEGFVEHRHDQSIFSILCKLHNVDRVSAYEYWYPLSEGNGPDWKALEFMPIHAKRSLDFGPVNNIRRFFKNKSHGFKKRVLGE